VPERVRPKLQGEAQPGQARAQGVRRGSAAPVPAVFEGVQAQGAFDQTLVVVLQRPAALQVLPLRPDVPMPGHVEKTHVDDPQSVGVQLTYRVIRRAFYSSSLLYSIRAVRCPGAFLLAKLFVVYHVRNDFRSANESFNLITLLQLFTI